MPYCCQCGNSVGNVDQFCGKCGTRQPGPSAAASTNAHFMGNVSNRHAALVCYIPMVGWIAAIVVLASERYRRETQMRFHAFQGLYLFVAWLIVEWVIAPAGDFGYGYPFHRLATHGLQLLIFAAWIIMIIKVSHDENYKLPIIGELA